MSKNGQLNEQLLSETINFLRFPLIVGVVLIHSHFKEIIIGGVNIMTTDDIPNLHKHILRLV